MKKQFLTYLTGALVLGASVIACDEDKTTVDTVFSDVQRGAIFRTISAKTTYNVFDDTDEFRVTAEVEDHESGALLQDVDVFLSFVDNTNDGINNAKPEIQIGTIDASAFSTNNNGLPQTTYTLPLSQAASALGLVDGDFTGGDQFVFRFVLNLTDGRSFTNTNSAGTVTGGSFFRSPFRYNVGVICDLPTDIFVGNYQMEWVSGTFPAFGVTTTFGDGPVTITALSGTQRVTSEVCYLPEFGCFNGPISFNLVCGNIVVPEQSTGGGVTCGSGSITMASGTNLGTFDTADDSTFTVIFNDSVANGGCGTNPYEVVLRFTKI